MWRRLQSSFFACGKWFRKRELVGVAPSSPITRGMCALADHAREITAPDALGVETRLSFNEAAGRELDLLPPGGTLVVNLAATAQVDSAGLSSLMLVQRRAAEKGQRILLRAPSEELRFLLSLTLMSDLFEMEPGRK